MPGKFDRWITDRIYYENTTPRSGDNGTFDSWIANRIYYLIYTFGAIESPSASPSESPSLSPSGSLSPSASASPSAGVSYITGTTCWGRLTGVVETNIRTFTGNWLGTGSIYNVGDAEIMGLAAGEYLVSEMVETGIKTVELDQNHYDAGDNVQISYRSGNTPAQCDADIWHTYTVPFLSLGFVRVRADSTL